MALPPGKQPVSVPGIDPATNPKMAEAAGELAAWIEYLLHPSSNDGPRIYRPKNPTRAEESVGDVESPHRMPPGDPNIPFEDPREYETVSVFEEFAGDTSVFFKAAQSCCGVRTATIEATFDKLAKGCISWADPSDARVTPPSDAGEQEKTEGERKSQPPDRKYPERHPARVNWASEMRKSWTAPESVKATEYERDFLDFQWSTEIIIYVVAEHLMRYRAILHKVGEDIYELMKAMVEMCPKPAPPGEGTFNWPSVIVTGVVAIAATVISGGATTTVAAVFGTAVVEMVGEAVKTAEQKGAKKDLLLENHHYLRDTAKQYLDAVNKIEREAADAIIELHSSLRSEMDRLRQERQYELMTNSGKVSDTAPNFRDYL